jgi:hypothetical protein
MPSSDFRAFLAFALAWLSPFALFFAFLFFELSCGDDCSGRAWQAEAQLWSAGLNVGLGAIAIVALLRGKLVFVRAYAFVLIIAYAIWIALVLGTPT